MVTEADFRTGYIAIIGRPNVGKSTLLNKLLQQKISITSKKAQTTRFRINGILTDAQTQFVFVDTPGFQTQYTNRLNTAMNRVVTQSMQDVDVILFVIEAMHFDQRDHAALKILPKNVPVILVMNKIDKLADKNKLLPFLSNMAEIFEFAAIIPVSAIHKMQLPELLTSIRTYLPVNQPLFDKDEITDRSQRFIAGEFIREKLFRLVGDEIPYSTSVVVDQFNLEGDLHKIYATILVEKPNQKAIIIGKKGEKLKQIASQARKDMELLVGGKVYLEVWVKVKSGWADSESVLRNLGYE
ncbi:MAG: GTPase Era [Nitrosomonas sp.]|jgi:GTP-binding protein Era|uniref:GTPase Era n=1 Tax=Nitrosomonas sp. TaxID=42353 RepID=UPI002731F4C6|nr:GTPase Era [Nitrosomonas sp.]MDP1549329.1 GTPase Era [Nitrosomonas sp.]MDP1786910.1 GTPase Era [Nitrosomonas sp.]MDP1934606.1 GTPase Era [Nitrosomonas sp.]MDP2223999.1 GTPase Era [Nitrosomonas sp.]MDP3280782.1 GTPase Era [Nitrosomonas sp.]